VPNQVKVKSITKVTHDVLQIRTEKPSGFSFIPGQATDVAINKDGWQDQLRTFTMTSLPEAPFIEFDIKTYPEHNGVTNQLLQLSVDDELLLHDVYGDIEYKGEGVFIAAGAGLTPFLAILRHLNATGKIGENVLVFANKTREDIVLKDELENILHTEIIHVLSDEDQPGYEHGYVTKEILEPFVTDGKFVYVCGPPPMMKAVEGILQQLHIAEDRIVKEGF